MLKPKLNGKIIRAKIANVCAKIYRVVNPIIAAVFEGPNAVEVARKTLGATNPEKAEKGTIRKDFGLDLQRNSAHGSDSAANAEIEINLYFTKKDFVTR